MQRLRQVHDPRLILEGRAENDGRSRAEDHQLPRNEDEVRQHPAGNLMKGQPWNNPMQRPQECIRQKAVGDGIRVNHPPAARRQEFDPVEWVLADELQRHQQTAEHGNEEIHQARIVKPADQTFFHQIGMARGVGGNSFRFVHNYSVSTR